MLADPEDLGGSDRSVVARARVARNPFSLPRTLVVKHYLGTPDPDRPDPFHYEVASCQLFTALPTDARPSPVLIAHDQQSRLLVLEDLGRSSTLADKLFGPDPVAAQRCLLSWARALGRMQAATAGREGDFGALLRRQGERAWRDPMAEDARAALAGVPGLLRAELGVEVSAAARWRRTSTARLLGGTRYRAFSPSDTCPDNNLVTSHGVRFVDFEWGCFRDVVLDAAYFRVPFPGCEAELRAAAGHGRVDAGGLARRDRRRLARPGRVRAAGPAADRRPAAVGLAVHLVAAAPVQRAGHAGRAGRHPVPADQHRARALLAAAGPGRHRAGLPATAELGAAVATALAERFPDAPPALPIFPALRSDVLTS